MLFCEPKNRKCDDLGWSSYSCHHVSVLFCEPKNRKLHGRIPQPGACVRFSALLRAEKSEIRIARNGACVWWCFSALLRAEKSEIVGQSPLRRGISDVSVLFCEPKNRKSHRHRNFDCPCVKFQCSSASRKIGNFHPCRALSSATTCFSALLRAEKSEISHCAKSSLRLVVFQCSSASRKIGNARPAGRKSQE